MTPDPELLALGERIVAAVEGAPRMGDVPVELVRRAREEGRSVFGELTRSERATDEALPTRRGDISVRVFRPMGAQRGVYLHVHGGGWALGGTHHQDPRLERLADETGQTVVSIDYRLAPEHPYPAAPDDCEAAAVALVEDGAERFGSDRLTIGGESAGAHLALVTALRLRDRHGYTGLVAANLLYGVYDLRRTPSARLFGDRPAVLNSHGVSWFVEQFARGVDLEDPDVSPLMAPLDGMPPALFTVGSDDPLLDDSLFMHERWQVSGLESEIQVFAGAPHAFDAFDLAISGLAHDRIHAFLAARLAGD